MATTEQDYYELLGVDRDADDTAIKRAFRRLARELHPDVSDASDAEIRFRAVAEAYEVLSDPERRRLYDRYGHAGLRRGGFAPTDFDLGNLGDVFAAFFGDGLFGGAARAADRPTRGPDVSAAVEIGLADAFTGVAVQVPVRVARTCAECAGSGAAPGSSPTTCPACGGAGGIQQVTQTVLGQVVRSATCPRCAGAGRVVETPCTRCDGDGRLLETVELDVDVPAGIHDGQRIRIRGDGHAGTRGGPNGDVYVVVHVLPLDGVTRDGDHLIVEPAITMTQAAIGATVSVPTPEGPFEVELPAGVQPGDVQVVRGKGMPSLESRRRGDLLVRPLVRVPTRLSADQRARLLELERELGDEPYRDADGGFFSRLKNSLR